MRLLFVKEALAWPRTAGHDVHCSQMMRALAQMGHEVSLAVVQRPSPESLHGLGLARCECLDEIAVTGDEPLALSRLQERFRSYWGIDPRRIRAVGRLAEDCRAEAVVVVGLNVLPYLGAVRKSLRIWYAADEWAWHHLSQVRLLQRRTWGEVRAAVVKGLYERSYGPLLDRVWVVSEADRRAMRWVSGVRGLDVVPNGVDSEYFAPREAVEIEQSCVFWGRLDFGPNVQALEWFCKRVWPRVRRSAPQARFTIYGFQPTPPVRALAGHDGIELIPDLPDLRGEIARHQVVVLPFVSGGGIKNKLLEAAALGKPIVCRPKACGGLRSQSELPLALARGSRAWCRKLLHLWSNAEERSHLGTAARFWVRKTHTWPAAASMVVKGLEKREAERQER